MVAMMIVVGFLTVAFVAALVIAEFADRRRSIEIDADGTRFAPHTPLHRPHHS
ncbi:MAG: hypothetical protein JWQ32_2277 [Marmoricola sp.]|nr:hypothetical protein [Marmoricola sp.]